MACDEGRSALLWITSGSSEYWWIMNHSQSNCPTSYHPTLDSNSTIGIHSNFSTLMESNTRVKHKHHETSTASLRRWGAAATRLRSSVWDGPAHGNICQCFAAGGPWKTMKIMQKWEEKRRKDLQISTNPASLTWNFQLRGLQDLKMWKWEKDIAWHGMNIAFTPSSLLGTLFGLL